MRRGARSAALFALKTGNYKEADFFPNSRPTETGATSKRLSDLCARYKPLKAVDITPETQICYEAALDICVATRAVSTTVHYLATFAGFLYCCGNNHYCRELGTHCVRFTKSSKDPDPLTYKEFRALVDQGCTHPIDKAAVTVAIYTGLRPGELVALAVEDVAPNYNRLTVRRSITQSVTFKIPKTKKERTVLLQPPAREALQVLVAAAEEREPADLQVWLNRHEFRTDRVRVLLSPKTQARKKIVNDYFIPSSWNTKWASLVRRAKIRSRPPYQTRHTYACWNLTAQGNLAFIANQMGHKDYSTLVSVYGRWIDSESPRELDRIGRACRTWRKLSQICPRNLPLRR